MGILTIIEDDLALLFLYYHKYRTEHTEAKFLVPDWEI
jgi:hypothetical protein